MSEEKESQSDNKEKDEKEPRNRSENKQEGEQNGVLDELRRLLAELLGTFALTVIAAGSDIVAEISHGEISTAARMAAAGLVVMAMIYTLGSQSGAHFNPVVSLAFALRHDFPWSRLPGYWIAQLGGGLLAALLLRWLFGLVGHAGATLPHHGSLEALVVECMSTFFLITVILGTATNHQITGPNAAIAVGATITFSGLFADPISGASMNPARSLGPALVSGQLSDMWIYLIGPIAGALLAVIVAGLLRGGTTREAVETAKGE